MLYLVFDALADYEMFHENTQSSIRNLESCIVEADSVDQAILKRSGMDYEDPSEDSLESFFCIQIANKEIEGISEDFIEQIRTKKKKLLEAQQVAKDLADFERLKKKLGK